MNRSRCVLAGIVRCNNVLHQNIRTFIPSSSIFPSSKEKSQFQYYNHSQQRQTRHFSLGFSNIVNSNKTSSDKNNEAQNQKDPTTFTEAIKGEWEDRFAPPVEDEEGNKRCKKTGRLIVYEGQLKKQIFMVKLMSISSSMIGLSLQPYLFSKMGEHSIIACILVGSTMGFFTFVTPILLHILCKRYVTNIYYLEKEDKYAAATYNIVGRLKELTFTAAEVDQPELPGPLTTIIVTQGKKKTPFFIAPNNYADPFHYKRLMGWDKPLDLRLNPDAINKAKDINDELNEIVTRRVEEKKQKAFKYQPQQKS